MDDGSQPSAIHAPSSIVHRPSSETHHLLPLEIDLLDGVTSLTDKSLLRQDERPGGEPCFVMLETIREFGLEQLAESGEDEATRRRHAEFFLGLAEQAEPQLQGPQQGAWLGQLEAEHDNLRAALTWALARGAVEVAL